MDEIMANILLGWQPEPVDQVEHWLWLAEQVIAATSCDEAAAGRAAV